MGKAIETIAQERGHEIVAIIDKNEKKAACLKPKWPLISVFPQRLLKT